jgi:hypothetical protein
MDVWKRGVNLKNMNTPRYKMHITQKKREKTLIVGLGVKIEIDYSKMDAKSALECTQKLVEALEFYLEKRESHV